MRSVVVVISEVLAVQAAGDGWLAVLLVGWGLAWQDGQLMAPVGDWGGHAGPGPAVVVRVVADEVAARLLGALKGAAVAEWGHGAYGGAGAVGHLGRGAGWGAELGLEALLVHGVARVVVVVAAGG